MNGNDVDKEGERLSFKLCADNKKKKKRIEIQLSEHNEKAEKDKENEDENAEAIKALDCHTIN